MLIFISSLIALVIKQKTSDIQNAYSYLSIRSFTIYFYSPAKRDIFFQ